MAKCVAIAIGGQVSAESEEELAKVGRLLVSLFESGVRELRIGGMFEIDAQHPAAKPKTIKRAKTLALPSPSSAPSRKGRPLARDIVATELGKSYPQPLRPAQIIVAVQKHGLSEAAAYTGMYSLVAQKKAKRYTDGTYKLTHAPSDAATAPIKQKRQTGPRDATVLEACRQAVDKAKADGLKIVGRQDLYARLVAIRPNTVLQSLDDKMKLLVDSGVVARQSLGVYEIL